MAKNKRIEEVLESISKLLADKIKAAEVDKKHILGLLDLKTYVKDLGIEDALVKELNSICYAITKMSVLKEHFDGRPEN